MELWYQSKKTSGNLAEGSRWILPAKLSKSGWNSWVLYPSFIQSLDISGPGKNVTLCQMDSYREGGSRRNWQLAAVYQSCTPELGSDFFLEWRIWWKSFTSTTVIWKQHYNSIRVQLFNTRISWRYRRGALSVRFLAPQKHGIESYEREYNAFWFSNVVY